MEKRKSKILACVKEVKQCTLPWIEPLLMMFRNVISAAPSLPKRLAQSIIGMQRLRRDSGSRTAGASLATDPQRRGHTGWSVPGLHVIMAGFNTDPRKVKALWSVTRSNCHFVKDI
ncbi:hypothetical protein RRG08_044614 [Elysia crispata]|uniref:Uncharacterized protein n=1 Tax=Elysia crispata TaxID=231223 RepID=A0AAE0YNP3_9GAST|nr:hypothetical protein RRG08_044614 [Elysia crispata]